MTSVTPVRVSELRRIESAGRIASLRTQLDAALLPIVNNGKPPELCIYATGSLARLEANSESDLDAFFLLTGCEQDSPLDRIREVKFLKAVIDVAENTGFPDFSGDGEYLRFLHIDDVISNIGGRADDYQNSFTARMLLILESSHLYNQQAFEEIRRRIVDHYFVDYHSHSQDFRPIFLINDILRFWRTLCLNYENNRQWRVDDPNQRAKAHLANLKLRFSRLSICFSFIIALLQRGVTYSPEDVHAVSNMTPSERLAAAAERSSEAAAMVAALQDEYDWFLEAVGRPKETVLSWIGDRDVRDDAFAHSRKYSECVYNLLRQVADDTGYLRYLVI